MIRFEIGPLFDAAVDKTKSTMKHATSRR
jgi:hypothetical protein